MNFPRLAKFACPACHQIYGKSLSRILLGPGTRRCKKCGHTFADGSVEWPVANRRDKMEYFFPVRLRVYLLGSMFLGGALAVAESVNHGDLLFLILWGVGLAMLPVSLHLIGCAIQIHSSNVRFKKQVLMNAGYRPERANEAYPR
jgi:hypothetical protein